MKPELAQGAAFFSNFRDLVANGFFTSKIGIDDLQYLGNHPNQWNGCPPECLDHLGTVLEPLFRAHHANHPKADLALLERAYLTAERLHAGQMRRSGDTFITHPLAVTTILADIGMTEPTLVASLLHDTVEDTSSTPSIHSSSATRWPSWSTA